MRTYLGHDNLNNNILFLQSLTRDLKGRRVPCASWEAQSLIQHFGRMSRIDLFSGQKNLSNRAKRSIEKAYQYRIKGIPLGYLLKESYFFGYRFFINEHTLIPRPETEILVEESIKIIDEYYLNKPAGSANRVSSNSSNPNVLDIGTGSGCIALSLTLERPACKMTALDISKKALCVARKNAAYHGLSKKICLIKSDLFNYFGHRYKEHWDIIVSNPPYIPDNEIKKLPCEVRNEPWVALDGGHRGLQCIQKILDQIPRYLKKGGWLLMEIGKGQASVLKGPLQASGIFQTVRFVKDFRGLNRILIAQKG